MSTAPHGGDTRLGVLAFGDSITHAGGELQWGVALHSWALWTARGLGLPYSGYAVDGATVGDVVAQQLPAFSSTSADPEAAYDVGALYIGANDTRGLDWDPDVFATGVEATLGFLAARSTRTLALTLPLALGIPPAGAKVVHANTIIETAAARHRALVVDLRDFGARNHVMADRVHPTAFGQVAMARRALAVLAVDGLPTRVDPATLIAWETSRAGRLRADLSYAHRSWRAHARGWAWRRGLIR